MHRIVPADPLADIEFRTKCTLRTDFGDSEWSYVVMYGHAAYCSHGLFYARVQTKARGILGGLDRSSHQQIRPFFRSSMRQTDGTTPEIQVITPGDIGWPKGMLA
jgi:hypothetical protein